jgi:hypothetical protein
MKDTQGVELHLAPHHLAAQEMYPKPCGRATKKQFRLTKGMDN